MRKVLFSVALLGAMLVSGQAPILVTVDLTKVKNDQVPVTIDLPEMKEGGVEYHMAKVVPGTYSISDFGRFVTDFKALDKKGKELEVEIMGNSRNIYSIRESEKLTQITYWVHDTFDKMPGYTENVIFEPGGTNIRADKDVFVINTFGFIGYIDGMKQHPYEVTIKHKDTIYGATSLERKTASKEEDVFVANNFNLLADAPIMYCEPDTVSRNIAGAKVIVSVYSPNKKMTAEDVMVNLEDLMIAQSKYLGGKLPVDRYAYLIFLMDYAPISGSSGALEHSYSSMYTLPEGDPEELAQSVRDVAAHEFFHIVTPLSIHSEEIHTFDFIAPEMSQHLWLYEGVTEYSSLHVQVKYGLFDREDFLYELKEKLYVADQFPAVSFTEMSERILEPMFEPMYINVYHKGALIGMCLDLHLIKYSDGEKDLQWLMRELAKEYGIDKPFVDEELFDKIEALTYPEVGEFLRTYVGGSAPLPIVEVLGWAGVNYEPFRAIERASLGFSELDLNEDQEIYITSSFGMDEFGTALGFETGDVLVSLNGRELNLMALDDLFMDFIENTKEGDEVTYVVKRKVDGKVKKVELKAKAMFMEYQDRHVLEFSQEPTEEQVKIREAWLSAGEE